MTEVDKILNRLSLKYNISLPVLKRIVESPYEFTRESLKELDLKGKVTDEEIEEMKTTFRFLNIGSLAVNMHTLRKINKKK